MLGESLAAHFCAQLVCLGSGEVRNAVSMGSLHVRALMVLTQKSPPDQAVSGAGCDDLQNAGIQEGN